MNKSQIIEKTISFYEKAFSVNDTGKDFLYSHRIRRSSIFDKFRLGYSDGSIIEALPKKGKIINDLQNLGILSKDRDFFHDCLTVPIIDQDNNTINIAGIDIKTMEEKFLFPDQCKLFNLPILNTYSEIYQTKNIMDLFSLETTGIYNVVAGEENIRIKGIKVTRIDTDINEMLKKDGEDGIRAFMSLQNGDDDKHSDSTETIKPANDGFIIQYGLRKYEIIGIEKIKHNLKATVKVSKAGKIHVDTINFYSSKARRQFQQEICGVFEELPHCIEQDLNKLLKLCEKHHSAGNENPAGFYRASISEHDEKEARKFGESENIIDEILEDYGKIGFVGKSEDPNKLLCYLAATSRLMGKCNVLSVITLSSSGAGKSKLQDSTLSLMPSEDVVKLTNLSGKALFYKERSSLKNKILALEECRATNREADYAIRTLISSGQLISEVTVRDISNGKMTTQQNVIDAGCTSVFFTSTNPEQNAETASRFFVIGINESSEQTREILDHQMHQFSLHGLADNAQSERIKNKHRTFQRLLQKLKVVNPFKISFADTRLQARRLFPQILNLINSVCFLRQMQKKIKKYNSIEYVEVDKKDVSIALDLAKHILSKSINELSLPSQDLLKEIDGYLEKRRTEIIRIHSDQSISKSNISFTRKELKRAIGWSNTRLHLYLKELQLHEYVILESGSRNTLQHYRLLYDADGRFTWLNNIPKMIKVE